MVQAVGFNDLAFKNRQVPSPNLASINIGPINPKNNNLTGAKLEKQIYSRITDPSTNQIVGGKRHTSEDLKELKGGKDSFAKFSE